MVREIATIVAGVKHMRVNLTARIGRVSGEFREVADNINSMAGDIERNAEEHDALLRAEAANVFHDDIEKCLAAGMYTHERLHFRQFRDVA